jgi:hypothetical protein
MDDRSKSDYPQGDGALDCPLCKGRGVVLVPKEERPVYALPGTTKFCECVYKRDLMLNLRSGWKPLTKVRSTEGSPLIGRTRANMWVRANEKEIKGHLRAAVLKHSPRWRFKVITDADLMTTWLYSANEVYDADVGQARARGDNTTSRVSDLVEPWDLLIIRMGYKGARNQAMPEVFLEALLHREHLDRPTWVLDSPKQPLRQEHRAWDEVVQEHMNDYFEFLEIGGDPYVKETVQMFVPTPLSIPPDPKPIDAGDVGLGEDGVMKIRKKNWRDE